MTDDLRELMACGHPKACLVPYEDSYSCRHHICLACEHEAAAVEAAREECAILADGQAASYSEALKNTQGSQGSTQILRAHFSEAAGFSVMIRRLTVTGALDRALNQARLEEHDKTCSQCATRIMDASARGVSGTTWVVSTWCARHAELEARLK